MHKKLSCLVIDDCLLDLASIIQEINDHEDLTLAGSFTNCVEALNFFNTNAPDVVLIDVDMPDINGLEFIKTIHHTNSINIIISAHPEFALDGFHLNVFDYILKPVVTERFETCIKRLKDFIALKEKANCYDLLFEKENIIFKEGYSTVKLNINDIIYLEAYGDYTKIITQKKNYLTLNSLSNLLESLPMDKFLRIHRSYVVAIDKVQCFSQKNIEIGDNMLPIGKTFVRETRQILNTKNFN